MFLIQRIKKTKFTVVDKLSILTIQKLKSAVANALHTCVEDKDLSKIISSLIFLGYSYNPKRKDDPVTLAVMKRLRGITSAINIESLLNICVGYDQHTLLHGVIRRLSRLT